MKKITLAFMVWMNCMPASSQSLGVIGEVFPVTEMSFLQFIQTRLQHFIQSGELDEVNERWQRQVASHANRPHPLGLPRAIKKRIYYFRPEVVTDIDIRDAYGRIIYPAGTKANALTQHSFYSPCWLFLNGDVMAEQKWAKKEIISCSNPKIILTGGAVGDVETFLKKVIYFDQGGVLTQKLGIRATPAIVTRGKGSNRDALQIEELVIKENGDVL